MTASITPVTVTGAASITGVNKTYDGLVAATGSTIAGTTSGAVKGDTVALNTSGYTLAFDAGSVGAHTINASGKAIVGTVNSNNTANGVSGPIAGMSDDYALGLQPMILPVSASITSAMAMVRSPITTVVTPIASEVIPDIWESTGVIGGSSGQFNPQVVEQLTVSLNVPVNVQTATAEGILNLRDQIQALRPNVVALSQVLNGAWQPLSPGITYDAANGALVLKNYNGDSFMLKVYALMRSGKQTEFNVSVKLIS